VMKLVRDDKMELAEAFNKVTQDAMEAEKQTEMENTPDALAAQATMASMAGAQPQAPISGPNPSQQNLSSLLSTLRGGM
jgi:hypothetical protein